MAYQSDLGTDPLIIDDSNASRFVQRWRDEGRAFGMVPRDYSKVPFGSASRPMFSYPEVPRSQWADRIKQADENKTTPDDWRVAGGVPILDQNGFGLCWCYGTVGAMMTCYAMTGQPAPHLSAAGPAFQGKQWRDQGGWAEEALRYIEQFGVPELSVWPEHSRDRSLPQRPEVQASAAKHRVTQSLELPPNSFGALLSVLTDPKHARPVTLGLGWWGHVVYAVRAVALPGGGFGAKIANSWTESWGKEGMGVLVESKATAQEQIAIQRCKVLA